MSTSTATVAHDFKSAFVTAIQALYAANDEVLVTFGHPGPQMANYQSIIEFADISVEQTPATMSAANRPREETLTLAVYFTCWERGGFADESVSSARAYGLLGDVERYARITDTTIGGTVRQCFLVATRDAGSTDPDLLAEGRITTIEATFEARARIYG